MKGYYDWSTDKEKLNESALKPDKSKLGFYEAGPALPVEMLSQKSQARLMNSDYYKSVDDILNWQKQFKQSRKIPLQWSEYLVTYNTVNTALAKLREEESAGRKLKITNTRFEQEVINQLSAQKKETNKILITNLQKDPVLAEACQVLQDWNNK